MNRDNLHPTPGLGGHDPVTKGTDGQLDNAEFAEMVDVVERLDRHDREVGEDTDRRLKPLLDTEVAGADLVPVGEILIQPGIGEVDVRLLLPVLGEHRISSHSVLSAGGFPPLVP